MKKALIGLFALFMLLPAFASAEAYYPPSSGLNATIGQIAVKYGVNPDLALAIAWCESRFHEQVKHRNTDGTKDVGLFQINDIHIPELEALGLTRYDASDNTKFAMMLMSKHGTRDFASSQSCWGKLYA